MAGAGSKVYCIRLVSFKELWKARFLGRGSYFWESVGKQYFWLHKILLLCKRVRGIYFL